MFKPVNRYIQIIPMFQEKDSDPGVLLLPDDYKPEEIRFHTAKVVDWADDVRFANTLQVGSKVVFDSTMLEEIDVENKKILVVLDNYVVGLLP